MKIASDMALALSFPVGRRFVHVTFHLRAGDDLIQVVQSFMTNEKIPVYLESSILSSVCLLARNHLAHASHQDAQVISPGTVANSCNVWTEKLKQFTVRWFDGSDAKHWAPANLQESSAADLDRLDTQVKFISTYHAIMNGPSKHVIEQIQRREIKDAKSVGEMLEIRDQALQKLRDQQSEEMVQAVQETTNIEPLVQRHIGQMERIEDYWRAQINQLKDQQKEYYHVFFSELWIKNKEVLCEESSEHTNGTEEDGSNGEEGRGGGGVNGGGGETTGGNGGGGGGGGGKGNASNSNSASPLRTSYFFWQNSPKAGGGGSGNTSGSRQLGPGMRKKEGTGNPVPTKDDTLLISLGTQHRYLYNIRLTAAHSLEFLSLERSMTTSSSSSGPGGGGAASGLALTSSSNGGSLPSSSSVPSLSSGSSLPSLTASTGSLASPSHPSSPSSPSTITTTWRPPLLRTCRMLYSQCLSAMVNILSDLDFRTSDQEDVLRTCDRSTDYHFEPLREQISLLLENMGSVQEREREREMDHRGTQYLFEGWEKDPEKKEQQNSNKKTENSKSKRGIHGEGKKHDIEMGDFVVSRHSNLYKVHLLMHLLGSNRLPSEEEAADESLYRGGVELDLLEGLENLLSVASESGVGTLIIPLFLISNPSPSAVMEQIFINRATTVLKTVRAFLTRRKENCDLRTIQFLVPPSAEIFKHYRNVIFNVFQNCAVIK